MSDYYSISEKIRKGFIGNNILSKVNEDEKVSLGESITALVEKYDGRHGDSLSVLAFAAEQGKLREFIWKLEGFYESDVQWQHPEFRRMSPKNESFFLGCYKELGVEPNKASE